MDLWTASLLKHHDVGPFKNHDELYKTIDDIPLGDVPWQSFTMEYGGERPEGQAPSWMDAEYEVWFRDPHEVIRNMLANPDFNGEFDYGPVKEYYANGKRRFKNLMSGTWAWEQAVRLSWSSRSQPTNK